MSRPAPKVGFIGAGSVLWAYLQVLDRLVPRGLAREGPICVRNRARWGALRTRRPAATLVASAAEVMQADVDVVVILTPPASHAELTRLALEHGKHVVCEKPLAMTADEAKPLAELAERRQLLLLAAPFVQLSPTLRFLWTSVKEEAIGPVHSARGLYGNPGSTWAAWYHESGVGPLAEAGIYNLKSLTALLGPVSEVSAMESVALERRDMPGEVVSDPDPDVSHVLLRHRSGALSSVVSSHAIQHYRRPALELYGTTGTANLLGDDWDPAGVEVWTNEDSRWSQYESLDATWLWTDGLREAVMCLREERAPLSDAGHDLHVLEVIDAARVSARTRRVVEVSSDFGPLRLAIEPPRGAQLVHDHTRPPEDQN